MVLGYLNELDLRYLGSWNLGEVEKDFYSLLIFIDELCGCNILQSIYSICWCGLKAIKTDKENSDSTLKEP